MEQSEEGKGQVAVDQIPPESVSGSVPQAAEARAASESPAPEKTAEQPAPQETPKPAPEAVAQPAAQAASEPAPQAQAEPVLQAEAAPGPELAAQPAAEPAAVEAAPPAPKPPVKRIPKPRGSSAFDAELATLLDQIYSEYDFQQVEGSLVGTIIADLWPLPPEAKGQPPKGGGGKSKEKWPPRTSLDGPRDYRLHVIACNGEGVWNDTGASVAFEIKPYFYQTWLFKLIVGVGFVAGVLPPLRPPARLLGPPHRDAGRGLQDQQHEAPQGRHRPLLLDGRLRARTDGRAGQPVAASARRVAEKAPQRQRRRDEERPEAEPAADEEHALAEAHGVAGEAEDVEQEAPIVDAPLAARRPGDQDEHLLLGVRHIESHIDQVLPHPSDA